MRKLLLSLFCLMMGFALVTPAFAIEQEIPNYQYRSLSVSNVKDFISEVKQNLSDQETVLKAKYAAKPKKVKKHQTVVAFKDVIKRSESLLAEISENGQNSDTEREFIRIQRLHYGVMADIGGAEQTGKLKRGKNMIKNVLFGPIVLKVPDVISPDIKVGLKSAKKEAERLFRPGKKTPVSFEEMAEMNSFEISRLEVSEDHPALVGEPGNHYAEFLKKMEKLIKLQDKDLKKFDYSFARRVLFFDGGKETATSPKISTKDRYGLKWKLKWGDEVHTDVAMTRLYIDLGGTYTDQKFYSGPGETILILQKEGKDNISTFYELSDMLLHSTFKFHADRYFLPEPVIKDKTGRILGSGIVDEAMAERESIPVDKIGCYYVLFKECQLSLYNPAIKRLGGASLSNVGADQDRVARSSIIFNAWIKNKDMKDDNSRVGLLYNAETDKFDLPVEFQSDLGCTLGGLKPSGAINKFEASMVKLMPQSINFYMRPLYVPSAWKACTWADARWMAMRIASLSREDMERAFFDCGWPTFVQKLAIEKLINRRNELVKAFKLEEDGFKPLPCDVKFTMKVKGKGGAVDYPVKRGVINKNSKTVKMLVEQNHPEGLADIVSRRDD